jgi:citrate lyase subunit beta/citryl-CoA lyase
LGCADGSLPLDLARSEIALASRLAGLSQPIDGVTPSIGDLDLIARDTANARAIGFGGKLCIHPRQIKAVLDAFRPTEAEIALAKRVVASGDGATTLDGMMIDAPVRLRAAALLNRASRAGGTPDPASDVGTPP